MTTDETTPVPTALIEALRDMYRKDVWPTDSPIYAIIACLPKPPPEFSDEVCAAVYRAIFDIAHTRSDGGGVLVGRNCLTNLYESGWLVPSDDGSFIIRPPKEQAT